MAEKGTVIDEHLSIHRQQLTLSRDDEGVDLRQRRIVSRKAVSKPLRDLVERPPVRPIQPDSEGNIAGLELTQAQNRIDGRLDDRFRVGASHLLNLDPALSGGHHYRPAGGTVNDNPEVYFGRYIGGRVHEDGPHL